MLGVNSDENLDLGRSLMDNGVVTWNSWADGGTKGPISFRWGVSGWPAVFVIDHRGAIRHRGLDFGSVLEGLIEQAESRGGWFSDLH